MPIRPDDVSADGYVHPATHRRNTMAVPGGLLPGLGRQNRTKEHRTGHTVRLNTAADFMNEQDRHTVTLSYGHTMKRSNGHTVKL